MINREYDRKIQNWIGENKDRIIAQWMDLVRVPSVRAEAAENAPFGIACAQAVDLAAGFFAEAGFDVRTEAARGYALAHYGQGEKTIGLFGHADVVPAGDGWLFTQPFDPIIQEGALIGRGACDDKSGIIQSLCVMQILRDCNIPLNSRLEAYIGSNEESGMQDITAYTQHEKKPDLTLVPDSGFPCSLGEKGILRCWAHSNRPLTMIKDFRGGNAFNVVLDHVEVTIAGDPALKTELESKIGGKAEYALQTNPDGTLLLMAEGVAKHAGAPSGGVNATVLAAKVLADCANLPEQDRSALSAVAQLLEDAYGDGMGIAHTDPDFGRLTSVNGMVKMEQGILSVSMDIRYGVSFAPDALEAALAQVWGARDFTIGQMFNRKGFNADPESFVPGVMCDVYKQVTGVEVKPYRMAGGTYARYIPNAFPVGVWAADPERTTTPLAMPAGHGGAHQRDERIDLHGFFQAVRVMVHAVLACDEQLNK